MVSRLFLARIFALFAVMLAVASARAAILITEVAPGINTSSTAGDTVELHNPGPGAVDLTGFILTDFDPGSVEGDPNSENSFAPLSLGLPPLQPGEFALVIFTLDTGTASFVNANFGLIIFAPLVVSGSYLDATYEQLVLTDGASPPVALDALAWGDTGSAPGTLADTLEDLGALTSPTIPPAYGFTHGPDSHWAGADDIPDLAAYHAAVPDFAGYTNVTTYGAGVLRRRSTGGVFDVASPDGPAQWEVVDRTDATFGNPSDLVPSGPGFRPILETDNITERVAFLRSSFHPDRRIATTQDTNDFVEPSGADMTAWRGVIQQMDAGDYDSAFAAALPLGYEVLEFLDIPTTTTFHILQERVEPGDPGYRGLGIYVFSSAPATEQTLILEIPHPINDFLTLEEGALAIPQLLPRATLISGTHRKNHTSVSLCDGTFEDGSSYRISDPAHYPNNFFHPAHEELESALPMTCVVQLHGFSTANYPGLLHDVVVSNGFDAPAPGAPAEVLRDRINAQNFVANDGMGGDLTTAALYDSDTSSLGATNNLQGRFTNGVPSADVCDTPSIGVSERFVHVEQDLDVREEPQHILNALAEMLFLVKSPNSARDFTRYE